MAYGDFTKEKLIAEFGIKFNGQNLFQNTPSINPSKRLIEELNEAEKLGYRTEKARSERIVSPIMTELARKNQFQFTIYSGEQLNVNKDLGLNGECDFVLSWNPIKEFITAPIFCIVEAEKNDLDKGIYQVSAQMIGAKYLNEQEGEQISKVYGCATTGTEWKFLILENQEITFDTKLYSWHKLPELLGVLHYIVTSTKSK